MKAPSRLPTVVSWPDGARVYLSRDDGTADALRRVCSFLSGVPVSQTYRMIPAATYQREYDTTRRRTIERLAKAMP